MSLIDFDRKPQTIAFAPWGRDVTLRPIGAAELLRLKGTHDKVHGQSVDAAGLAAFYADLLAVAVVDPAAPSAEWIECQLDTLTALGMEALRVCGLIEEEAKKN